VVHLGLDVHPPFHGHSRSIGAVVGGKIVGPQRLEGGVVEPGIAEALEVAVMDMRVDHEALRGRQYPPR
jgi:hypothetical protein